MADELDPRIIKEIVTIMEASDVPPKQPRGVFEREVRHEACSKLIKDGMEALRRIPDFRKGVLDNYFNHTPDKPIPVSLGATDFLVFYSWESNSADTQESLWITRNEKKRVKLGANSTSDGLRYGDIRYSEDPNDFTIEMYPLGDPRVYTEAERMIKELQLASI